MKKCKYSMMYAQTTPESVDDGDFSDMGFIFEPTEYSFSELVHLLKMEGLSYWVSDDTLAASWQVIDYKTLTEEERQLTAFDDRSRRYLVKAYNYVYGAKKS